MRHVFGMAKSSLDLRGAKREKLELDFLRMAYAVDHYRWLGEEAQGYLLVLGREIEHRVATWTKKYGASDAVHCICYHVSQAERLDLIAEKAANVLGMIEGARGQLSSGQSEAAFGKAVGERELVAAILLAETGVEERKLASELPFGIRWDFYGVRR